MLAIDGWGLYVYCACVIADTHAQRVTNKPLLSLSHFKCEFLGVVSTNQLQGRTLTLVL